MKPKLMSQTCVICQILWPLYVQHGHVLNENLKTSAIVAPIVSR